ncbi:polyphosphate kinase 2 [Salmonella enterica subsp. enterica]|nr:polyphosphate kinase 2 [Salmonella enterica subsp. enterica serovar Enteritidis]
MKKQKADKKETEAAAAKPDSQAEAVKLKIDGETHTFDIEDPELPGWVKKKALTSGGYPYDDKLDSDVYATTLEKLQVELVKMQAWLQATGHRVLILFEGRDAAGKGGTIDVLRQYMNPRQALNVALPKPTETERGQWYYQRYIEYFPTSGEFITFDRSWYNRAAVEPVMGFCTPEQHKHFLEETPHFEQRIVNDGIHFFKFWLDIGQQMQLKRFHDRRHSPLTNWKFSPMDIAGMGKWDAYSDAIAQMFEATHTKHAPWTVVRSNDKRRARLETIRHILLELPYAGRDLDVIGKPDPKIIGAGGGLTKKSA